MSLPSVGIDVEDVARFRGPLRLTDLFTAVERAWAATQDDEAAAHALLWCAREAAYKALRPHLPGLLLSTLSVVPGSVPRLACSDPRYRGWADRVTLSLSASATTALALALVEAPDVPQLHHQE